MARLKYFDFTLHTCASGPKGFSYLFNLKYKPAFPSQLLLFIKFGS